MSFEGATIQAQLGLTSDKSVPGVGGGCLKD